MTTLASAAGDHPRPHPHPTDSTYDAIVVGGRVAGASTALLLARQGHRVLVLDRADPTTDAVSTHAILRTGVMQLTRWGLLERVIAAGTPALRTVTLGFGSERIPFAVRPEHGVDALYAPRRHTLDSILVEAATEAGAEFAPHTRLTGLLRTASGQVTGVVARTADDELTCTARMVIGADGTWSRTAQLVGSSPYRHHPATNAVTFAYYQGIDVAEVWFQFSPGVNAGIIPTNDGHCCVFVGRHTRRLGAFRTDPETEFDRLLTAAGADLAQVVSTGVRATPFRGTNGLPGVVRQPWGPGWALAGDAGYTKDPISAHGISSALRDAELCARAVDRSLRSPHHTITAMTEYHQTRDDLSAPIFHESRALAAYRWDVHEASRRMKSISDAVRRECDAISNLGEWAPLLTSR